MYVKSHKRKGKSVKAHIRRDGHNGWKRIGGKFYRSKPAGAELKAAKEKSKRQPARQPAPDKIPFTNEHRDVLHDFATFDNTGSPVKAAKYLKSRLGNKITHKQARHITENHYSSLHSDINY